MALLGQYQIRVDSLVEERERSGLSMGPAEQRHSTLITYWSASTGLILTLIHVDSRLMQNIHEIETRLEKIRIKSLRRQKKAGWAYI